MTTLSQDGDLAYEEEVEACEDCGEEYESLNTCPYCGAAVCEDCFADHEEDEGDHEYEDEEDD